MIQFADISRPQQNENSVVVFFYPRQQNENYVVNNRAAPGMEGTIYEANTIRLNELEREAMKRFDKVVSSYDGTTYCYSIDAIGTEAETALKCHYVNVRILFEVLNVKL